MSKALPAVALCVLLASSGAKGGTDILMQRAASEKPVYNGTLRVKAYLKPFNPNFDPAGSPHYFIVEQLFDGLVKYDNNFGIAPCLAEYWTISGDGKKITFYLRKGVMFHNGQELTAEDVKFSLERLVQNRPGNTVYEYFTSRVEGAESYWRGQASEVSGFRVVDSSTFEIQWLKPFASGLYLLGMYYCKILPKAPLLEQGRAFFQKPVGTGPFRFAHWLRDARPDHRRDILGVRLERNGAYFGRRPYLAAIEYSPYYTQEQFLNGSVHIFPVMPEPLPEDRLVLENTTLRSAFLAMSCRVPPLDRPEVRRALALGLDKSRLAAAASTSSSIAQVTNNFIPPMLPGFFPRDERSGYEPEKARLLLGRLLQGAGGQDLTLTLVFPAPRKDIYSSFARELAQELDTLGIKLTVRNLRDPADIQEVRGPYLKFLEWSMSFPDPENIVVPLFHSQSSVNRLSFQYENPALDALIEDSEVETSWERRTQLFHRIEQVLIDNLPGLPLYSERIRIYLDPRVRGAKLPALGFFFLDLKTIWLEN